MPPIDNPDHELAPGQGRVAAARVGPRTVAETLAARSPLRLLAPRNHGPGAWIFAATLGGGLVDGDHIALDAAVGAEALLLLGTQASTKVYRSRATSQRLSARCATGALLVSIPDPVVCFAGATYEQAVAIELDPTASLVLVECLAAGRVARGERWAAARCATRLEVRRGGVPLLRDALELDPAHGAVAPRLGRLEALVTVLAVGPRTAAVRAALLEPASEPDALRSAAPLADDAALLRAGATSIAAALRVARGALRALPALLGDDPFARKH